MRVIRDASSYNLKGMLFLKLSMLRSTQLLPKGGTFIPNIIALTVSIFLFPLSYSNSRSIRTRSLMNSASGNKILIQFRGYLFSSIIRSSNSFFALEIMSGLSIVRPGEVQIGRFMLARSPISFLTWIMNEGVERLFLTTRGFLYIDKKKAERSSPIQTPPLESLLGTHTFYCWGFGGDIVCHFLPIRLRHTKARSVILRLCVIDYLPVRVRSYTKYSCCTNKTLKQKIEQATLGSLPASIVLFYYCIAQIKTKGCFASGLEIGSTAHSSIVLASSKP